MKNVREKFCENFLPYLFFFKFLALDTFFLSLLVLVQKNVREKFCEKILPYGFYNGGVY